MLIPSLIKSQKIQGYLQVSRCYHQLLTGTGLSKCIVPRRFFLDEYPQ